MFGNKNRVLRGKRMRDANIVKYRKLLYNIQYFCSHEKWILSRTRYNKRLTDFERGIIQGKHAAYNEVLRELHKAVEYADIDWEHMHCREEKVENFKGDKFIASYYKEHCQHGDVYSINNDGTVGEKIGVCSMLTGETKK